jgi:hypothetical protein
MKAFDKIKNWVAKDTGILPKWITDNRNFKKDLSRVINLEGYELLLKKYGVKYILSPTQAKHILTQRRETATSIEAISQIGN